MGTEGTDNSKLIGSYDSNSVERVMLRCYLLTPTNGRPNPSRPSPPAEKLDFIRPGFVPKASRIFQTRPGWQFSVNHRQTHPASRPHRGYVSRLASVA